MQSYSPMCMQHAMPILSQLILLVLGNLVYVPPKRPPLWSSGPTSWLQTQRFRVRLLALQDFLSSSGSGAGSTQPLWG
jgi:hypothetical protein